MLAATARNGGPSCDVEVWVTVREGPAICLLKSADDVFLTYLRHEGDSGFTTVGDPARRGVFRVPLSNGQQDEYPLAWCIEPELAYNAVVYFVEHEGERTPHLAWEES